MLLLLRNTLNAERNGCYCMIVTEHRRNQRRCCCSQVRMIVIVQGGDEALKPTAELQMKPMAELR